MRFLTGILLFLASLPLFAQGKVSTRAYKLADFPDKVTQVVLSGDPILASALQEEVVSGWTASAFECCTLEQFQERMTRDKYYFLILLDTPGVRFLTLLKGGPEGAKGIGALHEVAALPLVASDGGDGREFTYLGALVQAIQEYTLAARESERAAYGMEHWFRSRFRRGEKQLLLEPDEADEAFLSYNPDAIAGYVVAPANPEKGAYCYKMLFDAGTHCLVYLAKHKMDARHGAGFLPDEIKRLSK
ncbi:MAG: hypothetical protein IK008_01895 [Bacteroidales bacterium]|nr:hypothetical protein [Bacteroidales bacterium]